MVLEQDITFPDGVVGLVWRLVWVLGISVPLGAATYAWVERPTMDWSRRPHLPGSRGVAGSRSATRAPAR